MTQLNEEQGAQALGALFRSEQPDENSWLRESQSELMTAIAAHNMPLVSTFPLFREAGRQGRRWTLSAQGWVATSAIAAGALFAFGWSIQESDPSLTFTVEGSAGAQAGPQGVGRVRAPVHANRTLKFSDGSMLKLSQGGSVRVRETDEHGAEVVIETGTLESAVVPHKNASWSVFAGPYEIQVIGTRFSTEWDPKTQRLVVLLHEGSVQVVGSDIENQVALKPGQRFDAAPNHAWKVTAQAPEPVSSPPASEDTTSKPEPVEMDTAVEEPPSPPQAAWSSLVEHGKFDQIVAEAKAHGLDACYAECSVPRLRALADAARYTGEVTVAREALQRLRKRSPSESARAGYLLGSLSEARGQAASALAWYDGYLKETPTGPLAAEAQAGKMRALHALGRRTDAQREANEYLRLHPSGTSAATARRILNKK